MERRVSKLSISAEDLERRENLVKRLNRNAKNRLRQQQEQFEDNHELIESDINQEIKKLHYDLKGIREIGNHDMIVRNPPHEEKEQKKGDSQQNLQKRTKKFSLVKRKTATKTKRHLNRADKEKTVKFYSHSSRVPPVGKKTAGNNLFNLSRGGKQTRNTQTLEANHEIRFIEHDVRVDERETQLREHGTRHDAHSTQVVEHETQHLGKRSRFTEHETELNEHECRNKALPYITRSATLESKSRELDVREARNQARQRLLGDNVADSSTNEADSSTQGKQEDTNDEEVESYMYVPPDGRKRTIFLLPPLEELLKEASKARYLRIPKRLTSYEDDPERELSVDEIFSKSA